MVPWDRDRLPTLHGTIPPRPGESARRVAPPELLAAARRPGGERASTRSGRTRATGSISTSASRATSSTTRARCDARPDVRPWHLQRNGYPGIARWGGWVWSGDTDSSWKTLEAQIAVGLNYSLSIGPFWGSDIGGFYPNSELTGELYARWFQFAAFCGSFRSHGRVWWTRLPWGWGLRRRRAAGVREPQRADPARRPAQHPAVGAEQPGDRADREALRRAALPAAAVHLHARARGARHRPAADARPVAALSGRRARARSRDAVPVGTRPARSRRCSRRAPRRARSTCRPASGTTGGPTRSRPAAAR